MWILRTQIAKEVVQAKSKLPAVFTVVCIGPCVQALEHLVVVECRGWEAFLEAPHLSKVSVHELAAIICHTESKAVSKQLREYHSLMSKVHQAVAVSANTTFSLFLKA